MSRARARTQDAGVRAADARRQRAEALLAAEKAEETFKPQINARRSAGGDGTRDIRAVVERLHADAGALEVRARPSARSRVCAQPLNACVCVCVCVCVCTHAPLALRQARLERKRAEIDAQRGITFRPNIQLSAARPASAAAGGRAAAAAVAAAPSSAPDGSDASAGGDGDASSRAMGVHERLFAARPARSVAGPCLRAALPAVHVSSTTTRARACRERP
jgi:hypothetical protein